VSRRRNIATAPASVSKQSGEKPQLHVFTQNQRLPNGAAGSNVNAGKIIQAELLAEEAGSSKAAMNKKISVMNVPDGSAGPVKVVNAGVSAMIHSGRSGAKTVYQTNDLDELDSPIQVALHSSKPFSKGP